MRAWRMMTVGRKEVEALRTRPRLPLLLLSLSQACLPPRGPSSAPSSPRSSQRDGPTRPTRQTRPICPTSQVPLFLLPAGTTLQKYHNSHLRLNCPKYPIYTKSIFRNPQRSQTARYNPDYKPLHAANNGPVFKTGSSGV